MAFHSRRQNEKRQWPGNQGQRDISLFFKYDRAFNPERLKRKTAPKDRSSSNGEQLGNKIERGLEETTHGLKSFSTEIERYLSLCKFVVVYI